MEDTNKNTVEEPKIEGTGEADTQTADNNQNENATNVKTEAQKIADGIVAKKMKGMPTKEELKAFKEWQESQKTKEEKQNEIVEENKALKTRISELENMQVVANAGVDSKFQKFVLSEVLQLEGEFEDNLTEYLKENLQFLQKTEVEKTVETPKTTGVAVTKINENAENGVAAILKAKHPELFKEGE